MVNERQEEDVMALRVYCAEACAKIGSGDQLLDALELIPAGAMTTERRIELINQARIEDAKTRIKDPTYPPKPPELELSVDTLRLVEAANR